MSPDKGEGNIKSEDKVKDKSEDKVKDKSEDKVKDQSEFQVKDNSEDGLRLQHIYEGICRATRQCQKEIT